MKPGTVAIVLTTIVLGACAGERSGAEWGGQVDTLPNGALHVRNPASGMWDSADAWQLVEDLRIGRVEGEGPEVFGGEILIAAGNDGRIYVLDRQSSEVRMFDASGAHVRTFGRQGSGPGEFRRPNGIKVDSEGSVWVMDPGNARYTVFSPDGEFLRTHPRNITSWGYVWGGELLHDGSVVEQIHVGMGEETRIGFQRLHPDSARADTLLLPRITQPPAVWEIELPNGRMYRNVPFTSHPFVLPGPDGHIWTGHTSSYQLAKMDMRGDTVLLVERMHQRLPVTPGERSSAMEQTTSSLPAGATVDAALIPTQKPAFRAAASDPDGRLWVIVQTQDDTTGTSFDVFDPDGRYLGAVRTPVAISQWEAVVARDAVYGVARDEMDVLHVVRLRIERPQHAR